MSYTGQIEWFWKRRGSQWFASAYDDVSLIRPALDTIKKGDTIVVAKKDGETSEHIVFRIENAKTYGYKMAMDVMVYGNDDASEMVGKAEELMAKAERARTTKGAVKSLEGASRAMARAQSAMERDRFDGVRTKRGLAKRFKTVKDELATKI